MKYKYKLDNIIDSKKNRMDIENTVQGMVRVLNEIYKEYNAEITFAKYDSSAPAKMEAEILFQIESKSPGFYPLFSLNIPLSISLKPISLSERKFSGYFAIDGVSRDLQNIAESEYGIDTMIRVFNSNTPTTVEEKIKELFKMAEPNIEQWKSFVAMQDIFMF